jgi:hypothetical protein
MPADGTLAACPHARTSARPASKAVLKSSRFRGREEYGSASQLGQDRLSEECPRRVRFTSTNRHQSPRLLRPVSARTCREQMQHQGETHLSSRRRGRGRISGIVSPIAFAALMFQELYPKSARAHLASRSLLACEVIKERARPNLIDCGFLRI